MNLLKRMKFLESMPLFSINDLSKLLNMSENYTKVFILRMKKKGLVYRIKKGLYSVYDDPIVVAPFIYVPSYISMITALRIYNLTEQLPKEIHLVTTRKSNKVFFKQKIMFHHSKNFFGFQKIKYKQFFLPIALPEKAIIDAIGFQPLHLIFNSMKEIKAKKFKQYFNKISNNSNIKRLGFMLSITGNDFYDLLKPKINSTYVLLDPLGKKSGKKNKKWRIIENVKLND